MGLLFEFSIPFSSISIDRQYGKELLCHMWKVQTSLYMCALVAKYCNIGPDKAVFPAEKYWYFSYFSTKYMLWVLTRRRSIWWPNGEHRQFQIMRSRFESLRRRNLAHNCMALNCTESFIITHPSSWYDLNNVERDVKHKIIIISYEAPCFRPQGAQADQVCAGCICRYVEFCLEGLICCLNPGRNLVLLILDIPCLCKQCRSRSVGFLRSQLFWICTVYH